MLSDFVLSVSPGPIVASAGGLRPLLPVLPTTRRDFATADRVPAFTRVWQGGRGAAIDVPLQLRLIGDDGAFVFDRRLDLSAVAFAGDRSADVQIDLPLARLPPGAYLLTIEAGSGDTRLRRSVRFQVREEKAEKTRENRAIIRAGSSG